MNSMTISRLLILSLAAASLYGCGSDGAVTGVAAGTFTLSVTRSGNGVVSSSPAGIACGADCSESYTAGTLVTLTAIPSAGNVFSGWAVAGCAGTAPCVVDMTRNRSVGAVFTPAVSALSEIIALTDPATGANADPTDQGRIVSFTRTSPTAITSNNKIFCGTPAAPTTCLAAGDEYIGMDFRAADGKVYLLTKQRTLLVLDPATGQATPALTTAGSKLDATATDKDGVVTALTLNANNYGMDFNPTSGGLRLVGDNGQNLRINVGTGAVSRDPNVTAGISAAAYTNNVNGAGAGNTRLYVFGAAGTLSRQDVSVCTPAPALCTAGALTAVGGLGLTPSVLGGFDIAGGPGTADDSPSTNRDAYAVTLAGGFTKLFRINVATGLATEVGRVGNGALNLRAMSFRQTIAKPNFGDAFAVRSRDNDNLPTTAPDLELISFNRTAPNTILTSSLLTDVGMGRSLAGIDFRPSDGVLFALLVDPVTGTGVTAVRTATVATINRITGVVSTAAPAGGTHNFDDSATEFGMDFDPFPRDHDANGTTTTIEMLRIVTDDNNIAGGESLLLNPAGTEAISASRLHRTSDDIAARVTAIAYTNGFSGTANTSEFIIDTEGDVLSVPGGGCGTAAGCIVNTGSLGLNADSVNGFKIDPLTNEALAALSVDGQTAVYNINLATGAATVRGTSLAASLIGSGNDPIRGFTLRPPSKALVFGLTNDNKLTSFEPFNPGAATTPVAITGLAAGDVLMGIDYLTSDCLPDTAGGPVGGNCPLYGVATNNSTNGLNDSGGIYRIDVVTGVATEIASNVRRDGSDTSTPAFNGFTPLSTAANAAYGLDFNPVTPRNESGLDIAGTSGQHARASISTGNTFADTNFFVPATGLGTPPNCRVSLLPTQTAGPTTTPASLVGIAFNQNLATASATSRFVIDRARSCLYQSDATVDGQLNIIGTLFSGTAASVPGIEPTVDAGFDIVGGNNGLPLAALSPAGQATQSRAYIISFGSLTGNNGLTLNSHTSEVLGAGNGLIQVPGTPATPLQIKGLAIRLIPPGNQ